MSETNTERLERRRIEKALLETETEFDRQCRTLWLRSIDQSVIRIERERYTPSARKSELAGLADTADQAVRLFRERYRE